MEKSIQVSLKEILSVGWHCPHCGTVHSVPVEKLDRGLPNQCINCNENLAKESASQESDAKVLRQFTVLLKLVRSREFSDYLQLKVIEKTKENT